MYLPAPPVFFDAITMFTLITMVVAFAHAFFMDDE